MKRYIKLIILLLCINVSLLAQYQVSYISSTKNTITLRSVGYGKTKMDALKQAETNGIKAVLFQGIDNESSTRPLILSTETDITTMHPSFFNNLYNSEYRTFISKTEIIKKYSKDKNKQKNIIVDVTIKTRALRENLEQKGIIRKFGL